MNRSRALIIDAIHETPYDVPDWSQNYTWSRKYVSDSKAAQHTTLGENICDRLYPSGLAGCDSAPDGFWIWQPSHSECSCDAVADTEHAAITMTPGLRKFVRTAHIAITVGWLGAVAGFLVLSIVGLNSQEVQTVRAAYIGMDIITRFVLVPLSLAPLLVTGPLLSLGTPWGLFRHYWIIVKLAINLLSTVILLVHVQPISYLARTALEGALSSADRDVQIQLAAAGGAGLVALLVATALAVYKPRGMTPYGWRKQYEERKVSDGNSETQESSPQA